MKTKDLRIILLASFLMMAAYRAVSIAGAWTSTVEPTVSASQQPRVSLRAATGMGISFETPNGDTMNGIPPQVRDIPHLVLYRNNSLTNTSERTLIVAIENLPAPTAGVTVTLRVETQHGDPDLGGAPDHRIGVWQQTERFRAHDSVVILKHTFGTHARVGSGMTPTPTDYYRMELKVWDEEHPPDRPCFAFIQEYAFLLENQWVAPLPQVPEEVEGAAPDELVLYACDMFPFRRHINDPANWLARDEVADYLAAELLPAMVNAFRIESDVWGFTWYQAWSSYRSGPDAHRLSVAISDGRTWFHGSAPTKGHSGISMASLETANYDSLTDALMSIFYHELFHNLQRNINLKMGGNGEIAGADRAWRVFSEGTAVLATSVGLPAVEFALTPVPRSYQAYARLFPLNESYREMNPYRAALYWRFLYEQCGGMTAGVENPAAGMEIIRNTLTVLYTQDVVDIRSSTDLVGNLSDIMDRALSTTPSCPFSSYRDSLNRFARAIYQLHLDDGRCAMPGAQAGCGFYDPNGVYRNHQVSRIAYAGEPITYARAEQALPSGIQNSFGIDMLDILLDPAADGHPLTIELRAAPGATTWFGFQIWKQPSTHGLASQQDPITLTGKPGIDGSLSYTIPAIDSRVFGRLGIIITRLDTQEGSDPAGAYTLLMHP